MKLLLRAGLLATAGILIAGCGGGDSGGPSLTPGDGGTFPGGSDSSQFSAGFFDDFSGFADFNPGQISTSKTSLQLGESTNLLVQLAEVTTNNGTRLVSDIASTINFSSRCLRNGLSEVVIDSNDENGTFDATYTANGCEGDDQITAVITVADITVTAATTVTTDNLDVDAGSYSLGGFQSGVIGSTPANPIVESGESITLNLAFIDQDGNPYTGANQVFFSSACANDGRSEIDTAPGTEELESTTINSTGSVSATYRTLVCEGEDIVTATTSVGGRSITASVTVDTIKPLIGGIQFVSADPTTIRLNGTGGPGQSSQSTITFQVTTSTGLPLPNQPVTFELNVGEPIAGDANSGEDAFLSKYQDTTDEDGEVTTVVNAGTTALPMRVTAFSTQDGVTKQAQSNSLTASTGIPDQNSISISSQFLNTECLNYNGYDEETSLGTRITVHAADRYNNPVLDGTAIRFTAEGGAIDPECFTEAGSCSVRLVCASPKEAGIGEDHRITVLAYALGEESFSDSVNANGRLDESESFVDTQEPFVDYNENNIKDGESQDAEPYFDSNNNGVFDAESAFFEGLFCDPATVSLCNPDPSINTTLVSDDIVIVFSGSNLDVTFVNNSFDPDTGEATPRIGPVDLTNGAQFITVRFADSADQVPPAGTSFVFSPSVGFQTLGQGSFVMPSTNANSPYFLGVLVDELDAVGAPGETATGNLTVTATTPRGNVSQSIINLRYTIPE